MKNTKRRMEFFSMYDCTGIAAHLEKMALKGWALEKPGTFAWRYRCIEPRQLRYSVVYMPSSSEFDPGPTEENQDLQAFCAEAGWVQVGSLAQMHIFCNESANPVPIDTDPMVQIDTIHAAMKRNFIPSQITMLALAVMNFLLQIWSYSIDPLRYLSTAAGQVSMMCWVLVMAMTGNDLTRYFLWRKKAIANAREDGTFLPTKGSGKFQRACLVILVVVFLVWLGSSGDSRQSVIILTSVPLASLIFVAVFSVKAICKKLGASRGVTRTLVWVSSFVTSFAVMGLILFAVFSVIDSSWPDGGVETYEYKGSTFEVYHDELPLYIEDLVDTDYDGYSTQLDTSRTLFVTARYASQEPRMDALEEVCLGCNIYDVHFGFLTGLVREEMMNRYLEDFGIYGTEEFRPVEVGIDGVEVCRLYRGGEGWNTHLVFYDRRCVELSPGWELTPEQLETAVRILMPQ